MEEPEIIKAMCIIEMLGAPKDYIEKTLKDFVQKLKEDYTIQREKFMPAEENSSLFSTFCELEGHFKDLEELFHFCFNAMPSSIEIIKPQKIRIINNSLTRILNDLQAKIHEVDMELKRLKSLNEILERNSLQTFRNFIQFILKDNPKSIEELSQLVGVEAKSLKPFLDRMVEENYLLYKKDSYFLIKPK